MNCDWCFDKRTETLLSLPAAPVIPCRQCNKEALAELVKLLSPPSDVDGERFRFLADGPMGLATIMFLTEHFDKVDDMTIREIIDRERSRDNSPSGEKRG